MVEGEGMPRKNGGKGDLLIHFDIEFPKSMKDGEMKTLETVLRRGQAESVPDEVCEEVVLMDMDPRRMAYLRKQSSASDYQDGSSMHGCMSDESSGNDCCVY